MYYWRFSDSVTWCNPERKEADVNNRRKIQMWTTTYKKHLSYHHQHFYYRKPQVVAWQYMTKIALFSRDDLTNYCCNGKPAFIRIRINQIIWFIHYVKAAKKTPQTVKTHKSDQIYKIIMRNTDNFWITLFYCRVSDIQTWRNPESKKRRCKE